MIALAILYALLALVNPGGGSAAHRISGKLQPAAGVSSNAPLDRGSNPASPPAVFMPQANGSLPMAFEANRGQSDGRVKFLSRGSGSTLFLTADEAVMAFKKPEVRSRKSEAHSVLRMQLVGLNRDAPVKGMDQLPGTASYFIGNDPTKWLRDIPTYRKVLYRHVYPGIDLVYYGNQGQLEYDFVLAPGADPRLIALDVGVTLMAAWREHPRFDLAHRSTLLTIPEQSRREPVEGQGVPLRIGRKGDLAVKIDGGEVVFHKPVAYQPGADNPQSKIQNRKLVDARWMLYAGNRVGFELGAYDKTKCLTIDPALSYSTLLGGTGDDAAYGVAVDGSGNAYVTGSTGSADFPTTSPFQTSIGGQSDAFVVKLNAAGSERIYSTYLGGSGLDRGAGIAVDSSGNAYVAGYTSSTNFPTTSGSFQTTYGGDGDAFVTKLDPTGAKLVYSSYLGGSGPDFGNGIALDTLGSAYVAGSTQSTNFPTASPLQSANGGESDAFVAKVSADGSKLVYSTYLGGSGAESAQGIAVDGAGSAYVAGYTLSMNFPVVSAVQAASGGDADAFVAKLNASGSGLVYSTYLGGNGADHAQAVAIDSAGNAYVAGDTASSNFPATVGALQPRGSTSVDAFVAKVSAGGSSLSYSTYLGGSSTDQAFGIAVDGSGNAYVTGFTQSPDFPLVSAFQTALGGGTCGQASCPDAFAARLNAKGSALVYSTYVGGNGADSGQAIALDASGNTYIVGSSTSSNFPVTSGVVQPVLAGGALTGDAFVLKISPGDAPGVAFSPGQLTFASQGTGSTSAPQAVTLSNAGSAALDISRIATTGNFAQTNDCPASLTAGSACTINVTFTPNATGATTGTVTITDSAAGSPQTIPLTGTGAKPAPIVVFSPTTLTFGTQTVGTTSPPQTVTLSNTGSAALTISKIAASGNFSESNNCGTSLAPGARCVIQIIFAPVGTSSSSQTGSLTVTGNATTPPSVSLSGTAVAVFSVSARPASSTVTIGTTSATFTVSASAPKSFTTGINLSCTSTQSAACVFNPTSITPGQTSTLTLNSLSSVISSPFQFNVTGTSGSQTATTPVTVLLADFSLAAAPPLQLVNAGQSATYAVTVSPYNGFKSSVSLGCTLSSTLLHMSCSLSPSSVTLDGVKSQVSTLTVSTTARSGGGPRSQPRSPLGRGDGRFSWPWLPLAALVLSASLAPRRARHPGKSFMRRAAVGGSVLGGLLLAVAMWSGCTNYYFNPISPASPTGTPPGVFTIIVTGTLSGTSSGTTSGSSSSTPTCVPLNHCTTVNISTN